MHTERFSHHTLEMNRADFRDKNILDTKVSMVETRSWMNR